MTVYARVAVNLPQALEEFDYHLPPELEGRIEPGCLVVVPFGRQQAQGVVMRMLAEPQVPKTRPITSLVDPQPVVTALQMRLAQWMSEQTLAPLPVCIERMLPPGLSQHADTLYRLVDAPASDVPPDDGSMTQTRILALLRERGALRGRQIERHMAHVNWRASMQALIKRGLVQAESCLPLPSVHPKTARVVQLTTTIETAEAAMPKLARSGSAALLRRQAVLGFLIREPQRIDLTRLCAQTGATPADVQALEKQGLVSLEDAEVWRDPLFGKGAAQDQPLLLTPAQQKAWDIVRTAIEMAEAGKPGPQPFLLHGVTGSGKTEIYLQAVAETLRRGRQAIVLVPEIALTPQAVQRFTARFPGQVGIIHSRLSEGERYDTWRRARDGQISVIVGPRSALFAPLSRLGLVVVDECHDESYYQSEAQPYFNAVPAAAMYARMAGAVCLAGSATPNVSSMYQARAGHWRLLELPERVAGHAENPKDLSTTEPAGSLELPEVRVVDMRAELKTGNRSIFSRELQEALRQTLDVHEQSILFLNRRGTATYVFCRDCGVSIDCPQCEMPLTYHTQSGGLVCHYCGYRRQMPRTCPNCHSSQVRQYGAGTERVQAEFMRLFPDARTLRWDAETTRLKGAHEDILTRFARHEADVLIGTQMLAKGLDLPLVTLVGAVLADVGINLPDYRAGERSFQVLTQVAGRAGRSARGGRVIFQTYMPDQYVLQAAARHDFQGFYEREIEYRRELGYPPFYRLARLETRDPQNERASSAAAELAEQMRRWIEAGDRRASSLIGPSPCFFGKINGLYRWQIILRSPDPLAILRGHDLSGWKVEIDPPNLL